MVSLGGLVDHLMSAALSPRQVNDKSRYTEYTLASSRIMYQNYGLRGGTGT